MGTNLESCKKLTTDVTQIMGSSTFMGKVEPGKHWLSRKSKKVSQKCGTKIDPPPNDCWYQCQNCYKLTCQKLGLISKPSQPDTSKIDFHHAVQLILQQSIEDYFQEMKQLIKGQIIKKMKDITVFTTTQSFKVDFAEQVPHNDQQLAKMLNRILRQEVDIQGFKKIRKVYLTKRTYGILRIDLFAYPVTFQKEKTFGVGWAFILSVWNQKVDQNVWQKEDKGLIRPKMEMYDKHFFQKYNPHY